MTFDDPGWGEYIPPAGTPGAPAPGAPTNPGQAPAGGYPPGGGYAPPAGGPPPGPSQPQGRPPGGGGGGGGGISSDQLKQWFSVKRNQGIAAGVGGVIVLAIILIVVLTGGGGGGGGGSLTTTQFDSQANSICAGQVPVIQNAAASGDAAGVSAGFTTLLNDLRGIGIPSDSGGSLVTQWLGALQSGLNAGNTATQAQDLVQYNQLAAEVGASSCVVPFSSGNT